MSADMGLSSLLELAAAERLVGTAVQVAAAGRRQEYVDDDTQNGFEAAAVHGLNAPFPICSGGWAAGRRCCARCRRSPT